MNNKNAVLRVRRLGFAEYTPVWRAMQRFTDARDETTADELWLVEHPPVFTQGQAGKAEHVLDPGDIPVIQVDRGGQVTYHGPGQIVAYPLIDLRRRGFGVRELVYRIEEAVIAVLRDHGVAGSRRTGAPGVYVDSAKIAALGLRVRRGCSFHGLAFNVDMDLEPFQRINPCGFEGLPVTQLVEFATVDIAEVQALLAGRLAEQLGYARVDDPAPQGVPGSRRRPAGPGWMSEHSERPQRGRRIDQCSRAQPVFAAQQRKKGSETPK